MVEGEVVLHERCEDWDLVLGIVVNDLFSQLGLVDIVTVTAQLLVDEAPLGGSELARGNSIVTGSECAIKLDVVSGDRVVGVIQNRVEVLGPTADIAHGGVGQVVGVAVKSIVDRIVEALEGLATEQVVEGAVLHLQNDHILDVVLEVLDRGRGVGAVAAMRRCSGGCSREGQQPEESAGIHGESQLN